VVEEQKLSHRRPCCRESGSLAEESEFNCYECECKLLSVKILRRVPICVYLRKDCRHFRYRWFSR
jgi:hypothetical protein